jgi:hypothetical protein
MDIHKIGPWCTQLTLEEHLNLRERARIQKPVVSYDRVKFSVTNCARLPNHLKINLVFNFKTTKYKIVFTLKYCISTSKNV